MGYCCNCGKSGHWVHSCAMQGRHLAIGPRTICAGGCEGIITEVDAPFLCPACYSKDSVCWHCELDFLPAILFVEGQEEVKSSFDPLEDWSPERDREDD